MEENKTPEIKHQNPIILKMEDGTEYTLDFTRKTVEYAERCGFDMSELGSKMMVRVPELFFYSFRKNHPQLTKDETDEILFDKMGGMNEALMSALGTLFTQAYNSLINEDAKNSKVTVIL